MKATTKRITYLISLLIVGSVFTACHDKDKEPLNETEVVENRATNVSEEFDVVKNLFYGETAWLGAQSADVAPYLLKRFPNITATITETTQVVVIDESVANDAIHNPSTAAALQQHWQKNNPIAFINPSENTLKLISQLNGIEKQQVNKEETALIEQYWFYMIQRDGNAISYCKPTVEEVTVEWIDSLGNEKQINHLVDNEVEVSENAKGKVGERAAEWLNEMKNINRQAALLTGSLAEPTYKAFTQKIYHTIKVDHDKAIRDLDYKIDNSCGVSTTEACIEVVVSAGYDQVNHRDVYDVVISETFDAKKTYIEDKVFYKSLAYKYKYTGGNYAGLELGLKLDNVSQGDVSFTQAVPVGTAGSYSTTHTPGSFTVGGGISGGISPSGPSATGSFSFSYTPPKTTVSMPHSDLPLQYNDNHTWVEWVYGIRPIAKYPRIYEDNLGWGFNQDFVGSLDFSTKACRTEQAVTFMLSNTPNYEKQSIGLNIDVKYQTYHEVGSPFTYARSYWGYKRNAYIILPQVNRHFDKYSPYCNAKQVYDTTESWTEVENLLKSNVNYKSFFNENLLVGAPTATGVKDAANDIWRETINSIISQFQHHSFKNAYVVALSDSKGEPLKIGLYIHGNTWKLVEDISTYQLGE